MPKLPGTGLYHAGQPLPERRKHRLRPERKCIFQRWRQWLGQSLQQHSFPQHLNGQRRLPRLRRQRLPAGVVPVCGIQLIRPLPQYGRQHVQHLRRYDRPLSLQMHDVQTPLILTTEFPCRPVGEGDKGTYLPVIRHGARPARRGCGGVILTDFLRLRRYCRRYRRCPNLPGFWRYCPTLPRRYCCLPWNGWLPGYSHHGVLRE